jgi:putative ABC transport system substrate-binding protein
MKRREVIKFIGVAATAWPLAARAQQRDEVRRIGVIVNVAADDPEARTSLAAFKQALQQLGWSEGHNPSTFVGRLATRNGCKRLQKRLLRSNLT